MGITSFRGLIQTAPRLIPPFPFIFEGEVEKGWMIVMDFRAFTWMVQKICSKRADKNTPPQVWSVWRKNPKKLHQPFFDVFFWKLSGGITDLSTSPRSQDPLQKASHEVIDQQDSQDLGEERLTLPFVSCVSLSTRNLFTTKSGKKSSKSSNSHFFTDPQCCCSSHLCPLLNWFYKSWSQLFCRSFGGSQVEVISVRLQGFSKSSSCLCIAQHCSSMFWTGFKKKDSDFFLRKSKRSFSLMA